MGLELYGQKFTHSDTNGQEKFPIVFAVIKDFY